MNTSGFITLRITVAQAEALRDCVDSFIADCGIPMDDNSEHLPAVLRDVREQLADVPLIRFEYYDRERGGEDGCPSYRKL